MARTFSQDGGKLTLQKDSLLAAWRLSEEGKTQIEVAWLRLKICKVTMTVYHPQNSISHF
jgi:hypothetical protein